MTIEIDYPLGLHNQTITATAYAVPVGGSAGTAVAFNELSTAPGYYSATVSLAAGLYWFQINNGGGYYDSQWVNVPTSGIVYLLPSQFEAGYQVPPSSAAIAAAVAAVLFVDGSTNPLKVNDDHSVNSSVGLTDIDGITANGLIALRNALAGLQIKNVGLTEDADGVTIPLVQGDDYSIADGTAIPLACPDASLVGWVPILAIQVSDVTVLLTAATVTDPTVNIQFEMAAAVSVTLPAGTPGTFALRFTKGGHTHTTTVDGIVDVSAKIG